MVSAAVARQLGDALSRRCRRRTGDRAAARPRVIVLPDRRPAMAAAIVVHVDHVARRARGPAAASRCSRPARRGTSTRGSRRWSCRRSRSQLHQQAQEVLREHVAEQVEVVRASRARGTRGCPSTCRRSRRRRWARTRAPAGRCPSRRRASPRPARAPRRTRSSPDAASRRGSRCERSAVGPTPPYFSNGSKSSAGCAATSAAMSIDGQPVTTTVARRLAQPDHALARALGRHQVQVRQLGDGVAHLLVDRAGDLAALHVDDRDVHVRRGHRGGQRLVAIGDRHHRVGLAGCRTRSPARPARGRWTWPRSPGSRPRAPCRRARRSSKPSRSIAWMALP